MNAEQDDLDWLDAVAGRPRAQADPRTLREAALLRAAARAWAPRPLRAEELVAEPEALVARARREGVLGTRGGWCAGCAERWRAWRERPRALRHGLGFAVAALLAVLVFGLLPNRVDDDAKPVLRGMQADGVWRLHASEPAALRDRIAAELAAAGVTSRRYERLGRAGLDAELAPAQAASAGRVLDRFGVQPDAGGVLRIEVEKDGS